ncbi:MAG: hypothetical protein ACF8Q5_05680 [Phycisphaerales bacterium JB040]
MRRYATTIAFVLTAAPLATSHAIAEPVTYQGVLHDAGAPANGLFDLRFDLYDDATPGAPDNLIESETLLAVTVADGLFTVAIPFDTFSFDHAFRYIELAVRPAGGGAYTTLTPRQLITDAPVAAYATRAGSLDLPVSLYATTGLIDGPVLTIGNNGTLGTGIMGIGETSGVRGRAGNIFGTPLTSPLPAGVYGMGQGTGVTGASPSGVGVYGASDLGIGAEFVITHPTNSSPALLARTPSNQPSANAVRGIIESTTPGGFSAALRGENRGLSTNGIGVWGSHDAGGWGVYGTTVSGVGVRGLTTTGLGGEFVASSSGDGLRASTASGFGGEFTATTSGIPLWAHTNGTGLAGLIEIDNPQSAATTLLVRSVSTQPNTEIVHAILESSSAGLGSSAVRAENRSTGGGYGVYATHSGNGASVFAEAPGGGIGVSAIAQNGGTGVDGFASGNGGFGIRGSGISGAFAGHFNGMVHVTGTLTKASGTFKIDHPLDPANRYLSHSFVESPDMKNIYDGVVSLDADGRAEVRLPDYFQALNADFRYQLTCIGGYANVYIEREISDSAFTIAGGTHGLRVSWQVTGSRIDAYARHNPVTVEQDKPAHERGLYLHPVEHNQPAALRIQPATPNR